MLLLNEGFFKPPKREQIAIVVAAVNFDSSSEEFGDFSTETETE